MFEHPLSVSAPGLLDHIVTLGNDIVGCEIGICKGHTLRYLLDGAPNIKQVYAIDPYLPYQDWSSYNDKDQMDRWDAESTKVLQDYSHKITWLRTKSDQASKLINDESLDWIFIDGDHSYNGVLTDCKNYYKKVKSKRLFSGHDWQLPEVNQAVKDFRNEFNIVTEIQFCAHGVWFWYKD